MSKNCFKNIVYFRILPCQSTDSKYKLCMAGLLWELEAIKVNETLVFTIHFNPLVEKIIAKNIVFYALAKGQGK